MDHFEKLTSEIDSLHNLVASGNYSHDQVLDALKAIRASAEELKPHA